MLTFADKKQKVTEADIVRSILKNEKVCEYLDVNTWENVTYYSKEKFADILSWYFTLALLNGTEKKPTLPGRRKAVTVKAEDKEAIISNKIKTGAAQLKNILDASDDSRYRTIELLKILADKQKPVRKRTGKTETAKTKKSVDTLKAEKGNEKVKKTVKNIIKKKKG
jgi:hypothetical protein